MWPECPISAVTALSWGGCDFEPLMIPSPLTKSQLCSNLQVSSPRESPHSPFPMEK